MIQISNQHLIVTMTQEGGTLTSIRDAKTGREYLWQGDPAYWTGQAPNLFPFVGRLYEKTYTLRGKAYPMTIHGFVRHAQMAVEEEQEASCCFLLTDSPETLAVYPYRFAFRIRYALEGPVLQVAFQVENRSEEPLYCGMGGHPGFNVPLEEGLTFEDYELKKVNAAAKMYTERLDGKLDIPVVPEGFYSSWAQYTVQLPDREKRDRVQAGLRERGIPSMIYYPKCMHQQGAFEKLLYRGDCPVSERLCGRVLSLPMHPYLTEEDADQVCGALLSLL